jgi:light-regulated signal transduction histidine kinase (bacteriophytochrome)
MVRPDGTTYDLVVNARPLRDARQVVVGAVLVFSDATALRRLHRQLEGRVAARTRALEAANAELEAFAYSVSHDLRAPLRTIDGFAQALAEDAADRLRPPDEDHLRRIRGAARRMSRLIDDLLELARVGRAAMEVVDVDLSALAVEVLGELRAGEPSRAVETVVQPGLHARGDPRLLRLVLANLLGNAWKFTARTAAPRIAIRAEAHGPATVYVVEDNGVGFDPAYGHRLFGIFQRLHGAEEYPGTGVGLATVRRIVHRHGGRVGAVGRPGRGATFSFTLQPGPAGPGGGAD